MSHRNGQHDDGSGFDDPARRRRRKRRRPQDGPNREHINGSGEPQPASDAPDPTIQGSNNLRNLSEISHLFLSDMRSANGQGRVPPKRIPPGRAGDPPPPPRREVTVDLTIDEFESNLRAIDTREEAELNIPPVSAVIGARVNGQLIRRACQYAAGLAGELPVGLAIVEAQSIRLIWVAQQEPDAQAEPPETFDDAERLRAALMEMSCDIARWLVVMPDPRLPQARRMLAGIREWVLLAPADHEGVVAGYRVLKGLCDLELSEDAEAPRVTLAFVEAADAAEAQRHARKLVGVCKQFLDLEIEPADVAELRGAQHPVPGAVSSIGEFAMREVVRAACAEQADQSAPTVLEQVLLPCRRGNAVAGATADSSHETSMQDDDSNSVPPIIPERAIPPMARPVSAAGFFADDWIAASEDLSRLERRLDSRGQMPKATRPMAEPPRRRHIQDIEIPDLALPMSAAAGTAASADTARTRLIEPSRATVGPRLRPSFFTESPKRPAAAAATTSQPSGPTATIVAQPTVSDEVIDLPAGDSVADVVLARLDLAETAVSPPMLATAKLCVSRDGAIVLVAAASPGLEDLPTIGRAMTWATENRMLLRMALAQYRVDESADVLLHLLVSRADVNAEALRPLMSTGRVAVQAYRRLTWGGRCGLLLEAA